MCIRDSADSGTEASLRVSQERYDLLLLDLMLPGMTGEELIAQLRKTQTMPIIVISAKTAQEDKVETLTMGADDFITKPFDLQEVLARVKAQLRRYKKVAPAAEQETELRHKGLVLNRETVQVTPVSYTHLDVYKRQTIGNGSSPWRGIPMWERVRYLTR